MGYQNCPTGADYISGQLVSFRKGSRLPLQIYLNAQINPGKNISNNSVRRDATQHTRIISPWYPGW